MPNLIKIALFCMCIVSYSVTSEVLFDGHVTTDIVVPVSEETKKAQVYQALAQGIKLHVANKEPSYLPFFERFVTQDKLISKLKELVPEYKIVSQVIDGTQLVTSVRGSLQFNLLKQQLSKLGAVNRVETEDKSQLAFVFLARQSAGQNYEKLSVSNGVEIPIKEVFQQAGYVTMADYQFQKLTGGVFNKNVLELGYVSSGKVDWKKVELAAMMSANPDTGLYMVIGTFDVKLLGEDDLTGMVQVSVAVKGEVVDPYDYKSVTSTSVKHDAVGMTLDEAVTAALKQAGTKMATTMVNTLYSNNIY